MITVVCENTRIVWLFPTESKISPVCLIIFILTTIYNGQHPYKRQTQLISQTYLLMYSKYPCKILVEIHIGSMERTKYTTEAYTIW